MTITLAPRTTPYPEDIDTALDRFNDEMSLLDYEAHYHSLVWGEGKIEVTAPTLDGIHDNVVAEFFTGTPGWLEDFGRYTDRSLDATNLARRQIKEKTA